MSSSFSDNLNSQLDSDRFSVADFVMEVEDDAAQPPTDSPTQSEEQWSSLQPYQDEPIADPAWIVQYNEVRRGEEERRKLLLNRLNGVVHVSDWCTCGNCNVDLLVKEQEAQCCQEIEGCIEALKADLVVKEVGFVPHCITLHPGFDSVCLAPWSLRQAGRKFRKLDGRKYTVQNDENRYFRSVSYREYIQLVYGYLGKRRLPLPACPYNAIRQRFGGKTFKGFEDSEDEDDEVST